MAAIKSLIKAGIRLTKAEKNKIKEGASLKSIESARKRKLAKSKATDVASKPKGLGYVEEGPTPVKMTKKQKQIHRTGAYSRPKVGFDTGKTGREGKRIETGLSLKEKNKLAYNKGLMSKKKYFESLPANDPERLKWEWGSLLAGVKRDIKVKIMKGEKSKYAALLKKKVIKKSGGIVKRSTGGRIGMGAALRGGGAIRKR